MATKSHNAMVNKKMLDQLSWSQPYNTHISHIYYTISTWHYTYLESNCMLSRTVCNTFEIILIIGVETLISFHVSGNKHLISTYILKDPITQHNCISIQWGSIHNGCPIGTVLYKVESQKKGKGGEGAWRARGKWGGLSLSWDYSVSCLNSIINNQKICILDFLNPKTPQFLGAVSPAPPPFHSFNII